MNILLVLIPVTLLVVVTGVALFFWAVNHQQFDDLDSPAVLPLLEDPAPEVTPPEAAAPLPDGRNTAGADPDQG
jgi:cbb3-type cytochrome oxidase maturation protein